MCCHDCPEYKRALLNRFGKRKTLSMWKELRPDGLSPIARYQYGPGTHIAPVKRYRTSNPKGIHVWIDQSYCFWPDMYPILVIVHIDDLVRAGYAQAVFSKIRIPVKEWKKWERQVAAALAAGRRIGRARYQIDKVPASYRIFAGN